jgi:hypothetical protein
MSGSLPQSELLVAADGSALPYPGPHVIYFAPTFQGFAHQFTAVFHNLPHHRR